jgi:hypothetical protein
MCASCKKDLGSSSTFDAVEDGPITHGICGDCTRKSPSFKTKPLLNTLHPGKSNIRITAYPDLHHMTGENRMRFLIMTERIGESVLFRIDDVAEVNLTQ